MDTNLQSSPTDNPELKAAFRKPSNDAATRNYRKRSPVNGSPSSDGGPEHDTSYSPKRAREDSTKGREYRDRRKDDEKELAKDSGWSHYNRSGDSHRYSDRNAPRSSHGHSRYDDYKYDKYADKEDRGYQKYSQGGRESREAAYSDHRRRESDHSKSRDYVRDRDKYSRDKYDISGHRSKDKEKEAASLENQKYKDKESHRPEPGRRKENFEETERNRSDRDREDRGEKRDYQRSSRDQRSGWAQEDSIGGRVSSGQRVKGNYESDLRERESQRIGKERKTFDDLDTLREKERSVRVGKALDDKSDFESELNSPTKKHRFNTDGCADSQKNDAGKQQNQDVNGKANSTQVLPNVSEATNDLNAAKFAAMRAAELVNQNLGGGTGFLSTEQKKKLLWGNKKSTTTEESAHHWDVSLIADPERQEKFNKLMGVKGDIKVESKPGSQDGSSTLRAEKQKELQLDLEKQYTAGLRRRDGRTVGLGL